MTEIYWVSSSGISNQTSQAAAVCRQDDFNGDGVGQFELSAIVP
jgi:hypothetical protein